MAKKFHYEYHHWGANKKVMGIIDKKKKSLQTLCSLETGKESRELGNFRFK